MTEPIDFRILQNLKRALQAIAVNAGFYYDVDDAAVKLDAEHGVEEMWEPTGPRPFVVIELRPEAWEYHASGEVLYTMPMTVNWVHTPASPADALLGEPMPPQDEDRMQMYFRGLADVEKAIAADTSRGGLAVDTRITDRRWNPVNDGNDVWAEVDLELRVYRTYGVAA